MPSAKSQWNGHTFRIVMAHASADHRFVAQYPWAGDKESTALGNITDLSITQLTD